MSTTQHGPCPGNPKPHTLDDCLRAPRRHWLNWTPDEFDSCAKAVQDSLFAEPDRYGTPDMFADQP